MAQVTFNIPDTFAPRLLDALCTAWSYDRNKLPGETKIQFVKRRTKDWWIDQAVTVEATSEAQVAADARKAEARATFGAIA